MIEFSDLPKLNAALNCATTVLLLSGYIFIRRRKILAHKTAMGMAFLCSMVFLTSYVVYHSRMGVTPFLGQGLIRTVYFTILISHTILAATVPFLAFTTIYRAWKKQFDRHVRLARWTLPIWLYVSITGVIIYIFLYELEFKV